MAKESFNIPLRAVIYREDKWWIAHCLELDLVAEGSTPGKAFRDLIEISAFQIRVAKERNDLEIGFSTCTKARLDDVRPVPSRAVRSTTPAAEICRKV